MKLNFNKIDSKNFHYVTEKTFISLFFINIIFFLYFNLNN